MRYFSELQSLLFKWFRFYIALCKKCSQLLFDNLFLHYDFFCFKMYIIYVFIH